MALNTDELKAELDQLLAAEKSANAERDRRANEADQSWREEWAATENTRKLRIHELREVLASAKPST